MLPRTIVVAYDFSEGSRRALAWARMLRARLRATVIVLHADADPLAESGLGEAWRWEPYVEHEERVRRMEARLRGEVDEHLGPDAGAVETRVVTGRASEVVCEAALEMGGDLLVVGASGKSAAERVLLGSTAQTLVRDCPIPIMTVP